MEIFGYKQMKLRKMQTPSPLELSLPVEAVLSSLSNSTSLPLHKNLFVISTGVFASQGTLILLRTNLHNTSLPALP